MFIQSAANTLLLMDFLKELYSVSLLFVLGAISWMLANPVKALLLMLIVSILVAMRKR